MSRLAVSDITVPGLLDRLRKREWLVPQFQREFVWSVADVIELVISIIESRPIGMATLWEQGPAPEVLADPIWIPDSGGRKYFATAEKNPTSTSAILDGRQRCTAVAMAFGGLRPSDGKYRFAGRFFLNVATTDPTNRVVFYRDAEIKKRNLATDANCIGQGLFPLASSIEAEELLAQWMRYLQALKNPDNYPGSKLPDDEELGRRDKVLKRAFEGLVGTKLAVYSVPETYRLAEICEIFETLNTTGTKVSTVDLIHSWLVADTRNDPEGTLLLREWIKEFGQKDGAIGWSVLEDRPELITQIVTACYVALVSKPGPRRVAGSEISGISSVKAADLLATPTLHWKSVVANDDLLARLLGDFQKVVAGGYFPFTECPYPVSAAIYVALRWHHHFDQPEEWGRGDLDSLYRAFFWRNALTNRYDQGFLTKLSADLKELKALLKKRCQYTSANEWAVNAQSDLDAIMSGIVPTKEQLIEALTDGRQTGAFQKALTLPMLGGVRSDLLDPQTKLSYPTTESVELHHIYPKAWCNSNKIGELGRLLDKDIAGRNWVDSTANLMPLSRKSNNLWKAKIPGQILQESFAEYSIVKSAAKPIFIDEVAFDLLRQGPKGIKEFWARRAQIMAEDLIGRMRISL
ncbi:MAG: DUF262 domain-containing protein [Terriglobales bacterium]